MQGVYRPIICPQCRSDIVRQDPQEDCLTVAHCTTCGCTFTIHLEHLGRECLVFPLT